MSLRQSTRKSFVVAWGFLVLTLNSIPAAAQGNSPVQCVPYATLESCPECKLLNEVAHDGTLGLWDDVNKVLYTITPDRTVHRFDLRSVISSRSMMEIVPINSATVVIYDFGEEKLMRFDTAAQQISLIPLSNNEKLITCTPDLIHPMLSQIDRDHVLICTVNGSGNIRAQSLNVFSGEMKLLLELPSSGMSYRPWRQIRGGHDGNIYFEPSVYDRLLERFPSLVGRSPEAPALLVRSLSSETWRTLYLPKSLGILIAVDSSSNLYFGGFGIKSTRMLSPSQGLQWSIEAETALGTPLLSINSEGKLLTLRWAASDIQMCEVQTPTTPKAF